MKTLFLVRPAKPDSDDENVPDRDRPLSFRGLIDAQGMAERLGRRGARPDAVLCSPAAYARTTAEVFAKRLGTGTEAIVVDERLYDASPESLLELIRHLDEHFTNVMVFGHHPEVSKLADELTNGEVDSISVCAVAELQYGVARWKKVGTQPPSTLRFDDRKKR